MIENFLEEFKNSLETGYVNKKIESELLYRPKLLINKKQPKQKILPTLLQEFSNCEDFKISVAFVTTSGVAVLMNTLLELEKRNIKGKLLVSQYLNFTQPEALKRLLKFSNIELKIATKSNTHSKGYIFKNTDYYNVIVGSSNLTASALTVNKEWNLKVSGLNESDIVNQILKEFDQDFKDATLVTEQFIVDYEKTYEGARLSNLPDNNISVNEVISPNEMQKEALVNLKNLRAENKTKALIISATGTGKTYLSAFDVKAFKAKKLLFIVHRLNIAKKALETFRKLFKDKTFGLYSSNERHLDADFIFSTIQTISRENHLSHFQKDHFDYIIIDESHRSGADSYKRVLSYFEPKFLLGMTATPERTDGNDIFSLFNHNIAYEIRLNKAMDEGMLSQFHYYGVTDLRVNNEELEALSDFNYLHQDERVDRILEKANLYGTSNGITRGLVFCSRNQEAKALSEKFNERGYKTIALSGDDSEVNRANAIKLLESDNINDKIDYIFTVDIFNEGIDIPKINQIIMIRPTDSAIVFVQQLGRGLRKVEGKDYLTVIDFIGNHKNNYLIPIALYGDTSFNKDTLRKLLSEGSKTIPGSSTINFDEISKERIFKSIDASNMKLLSDLKKEYELMKYRLGRTPMMIDFLTNQSRDPFLFVEYSKSYYNFVHKVDKDFEDFLSKKEIQSLELFSKEINNTKRIEESLILKHLLLDDKLSAEKLKEDIQLEYGYLLTDKTIQSCIINLNFDFVRKSQNNIVLENGYFKFHSDFKQLIANTTFRTFLLDSVEYSIESFNKAFNKETFNNGLQLYNKYGRKDVCRLLNWDKDISATVYGYRTRENITPCFVTYHKSDSVEDSVNYNDYFVNPSVFAWESRSNRKIESAEIQNVIKSERILLFVKKEDAEGTDFYYMGDCSIIPNSIEQSQMPDTNQPVVHFKFKLDKPVDEYLYDYITSKHNDKKQLKEINTKQEELQIAPEEEKIFTIPLYDFYAAAGSFSELQSDKTFSEIEVPEKYALDSDYFACQVIGESMNKRIPNGSICVFRKYSGGSRSGKIFLIENHDQQDPDFNSAFTVKTYMSKKSVTEEGWQHQEIVLKPNSYDSSYKDIVIDMNNAHDMKVIGEFIEVLQQ